MKLGPHTIEVVRAGEKPADYGTGTQPDWDNSTSTTVTGCSVQPAPSDEFTVDRDTFITRHVAFLPSGTDIAPTDRVVWNGDTFNIDGGVLLWSFGPLSHVVVNLHRSSDG